MAYNKPHVTTRPRPSAGVAAVLEALIGTFLQTFGIGHMYAGKVLRGLVIMFGYWIVTAINAALTFVFIGYITWPITWFIVLVVSTLWAAHTARRA